MALFDLVGRRVEGHVHKPVVAVLAGEAEGAIAVYGVGDSDVIQKVGYIDAEEAARMAPALAAYNAGGVDVALHATIEGYWDRRQGLGGLGIWVMYDRSDFARGE